MRSAEARRPVVCALVAALLWSCAGESEALPAGLLGVWESHALAYAGRYFELRPTQVIFGTGGHRLSMHPIEFVHSEAVAEGGRLYTLRYRGDDGDSRELRLLFRDAPGRTLRFSNRNEDWVPARAGANDA